MMILIIKDELLYDDNNVRVFYTYRYFLFCWMVINFLKHQNVVMISKTDNFFLKDLNV